MCIFTWRISHMANSEYTVERIPAAHARPRKINSDPTTLHMLYRSARVLWAEVPSQSGEKCGTAYMPRYQSLIKMPL